tara:strand:+ start:1450 stop:2022 length:573 start_codon:yes stop_codon:yes gene_type:complete
MSEGPISIVSGGVNLAKMAVQSEGGHWPSLPEGVELAPLWKRTFAFLLDTAAFMGVLTIITGGSILSAFWFGLLATTQWWVVFVNWMLIIAAAFLYHKYTIHGMGRSLGQRWFGLAVVREDGERLNREQCDKRSMMKLRYMIPIIGIICFFSDAKHIRNRHTHQSSIDLSCASIVVIANSLPPAKRYGLR